MQDRYEPFVSKVSYLPSCDVHIRKKAEGSELFACTAFSAFCDSIFPASPVMANNFRFVKCGDGVALWEEENAVAWVHNGYKEIDVVMSSYYVNDSAISQLILRAYQYTALFSNSLMIHSATVVYNGEAVMFCGVPGAGKSTQSRLWQKVYGAEPLNNDQPCIIEKDGALFAHGTPWSGKEPCYKNESYPVKAIVFIEKAPYEKVTKMPCAEAFSMLYLNNYVVPVSEDTEETYYSAVNKIASALPVYRQFCTVNESAPKELFKTLYQ